MFTTATGRKPSDIGKTRPSTSEVRTTQQTGQDGQDSPTAQASQSNDESRMTKIARRAHEIYQARGGEHGKALDDWLQAEREVDAEIEALQA
jgi:hypothetical protein